MQLVRLLWFGILLLINLFAISDPGIWLWPDWLLVQPRIVPGAPEKRPPVIFVPGAGGSLLVADRQNTITFPTTPANKSLSKDGPLRTATYAVDEVAWLDWYGLIHHAIADAEYFGMLRFGDNVEPLTRDFQAKHNGLVPLPGAYPDVIPFFVANGYELDRDLFVFTYDWRRSAGDHVKDLDAVVAEALRLSRTGTVDFIAHSQGTLVVRTYLTSEKAMNRAKVRKAVLMAGPFLGTPDGTQAAIPGRCLTRKVGLCALRERTEQYVERTMPGPLELSVSRDYFDGTPRGSDRRSEVFIDDRPLAASVPPGYDGVREAMRHENVSEAALKIAEAWHENDLRWLEAVPRDVSVLILVGTGLCTTAQIRRYLDLTFLRTWFEDVPLFGSRVGYEISRYIDGDRTVVQRSAAMGDLRNIYFRDFTHGDFVSADKGLILALQLIYGQQVPQEGPRKPADAEDLRNCDRS